MQNLDHFTYLYIDPVCWTKVSSDMKDFRTTYLMRTYYFCSESCLKDFLSDPEKYLDYLSSKRQGWGKHYLTRFIRAAGFNSNGYQ